MVSPPGEKIKIAHTHVKNYTASSSNMNFPLIKTVTAPLSGNLLDLLPTLRWMKSWVSVQTLFKENNRGLMPALAEILVQSN